MRLLLVGAGAEGPAWPAALERAGTAVRAAACEGPDGVAAALRDPLDLILVWEEAGERRSEEVLDALLRDGLEVPVAVVATAAAEDVPQAEAVLPRDVPGWFPGAFAGIARRRSLEACLSLTGRVAHDLNNLLAPIPLAAQLLRRSAGSPASEGQVEAIDTASRGSMAAVRELAEVLVASLDGPLRVRAKHLLAIAARHWRQALAGRPEAPVGVLADYQPDLASVRVDVLRVLQVLACLARRCLDAAPGGELLFQGRNAGERPALGGPAVELRVACAASGVEGLLAGAEVEAGVREGGDEGLAALREVVEGQGGELGVLPSGPDHRGFVVLLPVASGGRWSATAPGRRTGPGNPRSSGGAGGPASKAAGGTGAPAAGAGAAPAGRTVLVIDGDEECRRMTVETLRGFGYRVLEAADGTEGVALYAARSGGVAAVVVEYSLPYMDGPTTIKALRRIAPEVPQILATGADWEARRFEQDHGGPDAVLRKPFDAEALLATLRRALGEETR